MSVAAATPTSWRGDQRGSYGHAAYDPAQSFAYTSACSGPRLPSPTGSTGSLGGPSDGILSRKLVQEGLTDLGRTGDGSRVTYLTLTLANLSLLDISLLSSYPFIQRLTLASNNLTDVSSLGNLPQLIFLDVSHNKLTSILDFQPPPRNLLEANYSYNDIEEICDLSAHHSLTKLILDSNQITQISGLSSLSRLSHLSLADNRIECISNLDHLPIRFLRLSSNGIKVIENLGTLTNLQIIDLSQNTISSLKGLEGHPYLSEIDMEDNRVVDVKEVVYLKGLQMLRILNLSNNPVETLLDYRPLMVFHLPALLQLDCRMVNHKEKVAAINRFSPCLEVVAAQDHRVNIAASVHKQARIRFSTLTQIEEPYPMLVLCGPPGSGKGYFCKLLVEEFPGFFGLGVSHTTRQQRSKESHGRDYFFIDNNTFSKAMKKGEFVVTHRTPQGRSYGLTMSTLEHVAQLGLACVTHMGLEGVLSLKNTHFEPRYILALPLTRQIHEQRLRAKGCYSNEEIKKALDDVDMYKEYHMEKPGFFDTAINTDSLKNGYIQLRALVMAYGDITPESPLSFSSSSSSSSSPSTSSLTTSEQTTTQPHTGTQSPSLVDPFEVDTGITPTMKTPPYPTVEPEVVRHMQEAARSWSTPRSSTPASQRLTPGGSRPDSRISEYSGRRITLIKAAIKGYSDSFGSASRPDTGLSKAQSKTVSGSAADELEDSSEGSSPTPSQSSLSKLSSQRGFSPTEQLASPVSTD